MKTKTKYAAAAVAALLAGAVWFLAFPASAGATGDHEPYCSIRTQPPAAAAATETVDQKTYEPTCKPIPPATVTQPTCTTDGFVTIPDHGRKLDFYIDDVEVQDGDYPVKAGTTVHVHAEVDHDGDNEPDYHEAFEIVEPDCTVTPNVTVTQLDCAQGSVAGTITVHAVDHVTYHYTDFDVPPGDYAVPPGTYEFHAEADEGYEIPEGDEHISVTVNPVNGCPGEPGEPGEPGLPGAPGAPGAPGPAAPPAVQTPRPATPVVQSPDFTG